MTPDGDYGVPGSLAKVLADIAAERVAQDARWGVQDIGDGTGPRHTADADRAKEEVGEAARQDRLTWRHILWEEVLEAFAEDEPGPLRTELIQVAAVAAKWAQALDGRRPRQPSLRHARVGPDDAAGGRPPRPALLVIYTPALEACRAFYGSLGLEFRPERHGTGARHYASVLGDGTVFEIYPSTPARTTGALRLGFTLDPGSGVDGTPRTPGRHLLQDPDGRTVEIHIPPA